MIPFFQFDSSERSNFLNSAWSPYSLSPINANSAQLLNHSYSKGVSKISKVPLKVFNLNTATIMYAWVRFKRESGGQPFFTGNFQNFVPPF